MGGGVKTVLEWVGGEGVGGRAVKVSLLGRGGGYGLAERRRGTRVSKGYRTRVARAPWLPSPTPCLPAAHKLPTPANCPPVPFPSTSRKARLPPPHNPLPP